MKRRLVIVALVAAGLVGGGVTGAQAGERRTRGTDWACIFVTDLDRGVCQQNPLPDELPVPEEARLLPPA